jgi:hypothetical protein
MLDVLEEESFACLKILTPPNVQQHTFLAVMHIQKVDCTAVPIKMHVCYYLCFVELFVLFHPQTPFVRQNTPHPKELKAKAHKLFGKGKTSDGKAAVEQMVSKPL